MNQKNLMKSAVSFAFLVGATAAMAAGTAPVQAPQAMLVSPVASLSFPGMFGAPSAVAPLAGSGFAGVTYVNPRGGVAGSGGDADVSAGYTIGNPVTNVSVTFGLAITGTQPIRDFADAGSLSISASRLLQAGGTSATFVGASASNLAKWGAGKDEHNYSVYLSHLTGFKAGGVEVPLQFVVGYGNNNTRDTSSGFDGTAGGIDLLDNGGFAGVGVGLSRNLSGSISFNSVQTNVGFTVSVPNTNMSVTLGVLDVDDRTRRRQTVLSLGVGF